MVISKQKVVIYQSSQLQNNTARTWVIDTLTRTDNRTSGKMQGKADLKIATKSEP